MRAESSSAAAVLAGGGSITINGTSTITHVQGVDRQSGALPDRHRGQDERRPAATADPSPETGYRNLPIPRNAARQDLTGETFRPQDLPSIDLRDDYGGNWFSRARDTRTGYVQVLGSRQEKGLYIDIRV